MEFNKFKLKELLQVNPRMTLKKGSKAKKIAMENIKEFQKKIDNFTIEEFKSGSKFQNGDTLLARITPCLENGKTAYVDILEDEEIAFGSTEFFVLRPIDNKLDSQFLYYLFRTKKIREVIIKSMTGTSGRQRAQKDAILEYECEIPTIEYQRKIAIILKNLDDKIEINKKTIANLEELSQTLFKRWFVDFEFPDENGAPYKANGGEMTNSELGEIPKVWRVETLEKLGSIIGGGTPSKKNKEYYTNNGIPWITPKDLSKNRNIYISHGENDISELGLNKSSAKLLEKNSVLFSSRAPIGYIAINNIPVTTNQGFKSIVPNEEMNPYFIYFILKNITPLIEQTASGSTFKEISAKGMKSIKIVFPSIELIKQYGNIVKKYFKEINFLENQNIKLIELRDTLLPKLMSGEIEIPDDVEVNTDELSI
ncbi:restriction endonuclease subunit S [Staphylococcus epidermidis]|uniref:restriction endonuclease subunit S n=1 Tax=Staphylococcus epidermidis TaxID=1282 RepID=UPI001F19BF18|nr:restriction endonuclease subunit S [Staphylococcus epidermidis]MCE4982577.1 restriction endonuclease subunit S [Staphylococcus epidermidis]